MFHNNQGDILKQEVLTKRATGRKKAYSLNFKERLFVLTSTHLTYYEGNEKSRKKEKGSLELKKIRSIERLDDTVLKKKFAFQIGYVDYILYIITKNEKQRDDWIKILREEVVSKENMLQQKYHRDTYAVGGWSCCKEKERDATGCQNSFVFKTPNGGDKGVRKSRKNHPLPPIPSSRTMPCEVFKVTARYDLTPGQDTDLPLIKDREYTVLNNRETDWWYARDDMGRKGYIPSSYVVVHTGIESEKWYYKGMTRQEADFELRNCFDGTFLVRDSSQKDMFTLSFCFQNIVRHYHIKMGANKKHYVSPKHSFDTVSQLIEYHKHNSAGLVIRLRFPFTGNDKPPLVLGSGVFEINRNDLKIEEKIGSGQFGNVYVAWLKGQNKVAVKIMKPGTMSEHDFIEEAKVMKRFKDRNLVEIYGICSTQSPLYIVVELLKYGSLQQYLIQNTYLNTDTKLLTDIVLQVSSAMKCLENFKFIHRDLATRNCLVGENNLIKVSDFGLSRYVLDDQYTASEGSRFSMKWAAPEIFDFNKFSSKSDVWAFGVLCWEVFSSAASPYSCFTLSQIPNEVRAGYRLGRPENCPHEIYKLMLECWKNLPNDRPSFFSIHGRLGRFSDIDIDSVTTT